MLSQETINIIKATVPVVAKHAEQITAHFYPLMFKEFPEVKAFFNQSHQAQGAQPRALAAAVVAYAANIDNLSVLAPAVERIVQKHVSLNIQPAQYEIVGSCLLKAIKEVLGEAATDEVITAWGEAYWQLANLLIEAEQACYLAKQQCEGGWKGEREFNVVRKEAESDVITSFYLEPVDGGSVPEFKPGQYIGLVIAVGDQDTRRNYSLSSSPNRRFLRISVKREPNGLVSNHLHDTVNIGDTLQILPPAGDFVLKNSDRPLILVTGGVGITPAVSMLDQALASGRAVHFIHASLNSRTHAFRDHVDQLAAKHNNLKQHYCYSEPLAGDKPNSTGFVTKALLDEQLGTNSEVDFYFLGPKPFMTAMYKNAVDLGISEGNIYYEFFGPLEDITSPANEPAVA
jgi:nitric oxide dioxygenase